MECNDYQVSMLFGRHYVVPDYQRPYAWENKQIEEFFADLVQFVESPELSDDFYMFGQIIVHKDGKTYNIVDGQQRIATSTIFLCALRDYLKKHHKDEESTLNKVYNAIGFDDNDGFKVKLGSINQEFFYDYVQLGKHDKKPKSRYDKLIKNAYDTLSKKIEDYDSGRPFQDLKKIIDAFLDSFHVSYVETSNLNQAFIIFETLNSRGKPLDTTDLLKNRFFCYLGKKYPYIKDEWSRMIISITELDGSPTQLVRYYWNATHELVRDKKLFESVSKVTEQAELKKIFDEIIEASKIYEDILRLRECDWISESSLDSLINLNTMDATSYIPLIISMRLKEYGSKEIEEALLNVETLIFRNQVVMKKTANKNEVIFSRVACELYNETMTLEEVLDDIRKHTATDEEMRIPFEICEPNPTIGRMILTNLYNYDHPELKIKSSRAVHVEHIMPQTKGKWNIDEAIWAEYKNRLGNMALLDGKKNIAASNDVFSKKKPRYEQSDIDDTRNITKYSEWTDKEIKDRQAELFKKVCKKWPVS